MLDALVPLLLCEVFWTLSHGYRGLFHDARLYTLQALSRLHPGSLSQDVFLRFGSQDSFTIFSPLYEAFIRLWGPDWAAALLTLASQVALFAGAWFLARSALAPRLALLGVAVLAAIPGDYGTDRIFACVEQFLTPRMAAEALVLAALAAALRQRHWPALTLLLLAGMLHPLMAAAGAAALVCQYVIAPRPRAGVAILGAATLLTAGSALLAPSLMSFDPLWLQLVRERCPYLFLSNWTIDDWGRVAVTLATLAVGVRRLPGDRARLLCQAALLTTAGGLLLSFIGCDELHLVWVTQLQPWRWQWLGIATAALMLPAILQTCAIPEHRGRITALLLAAAWIFGDNAFSLFSAVAAVASTGASRWFKPSETRWIVFGALALLALALVWRIASNLVFTDEHYLELQMPRWQRLAISFAHDGSAPLGAIALAWWLMRAPGGRIGLKALALLAAAAALALLPQTWAQWTHREFPPERIADFAPWRAAIPPGAQVFWPDSPFGAWLLLDRPSYLSPMQSAGIVFSRTTALELQRRALELQSVIAPQEFLSWASPGPRLTVQQLLGACRLAVFDYLVTGADLGVPPLAIMAASGEDLRQGSAGLAGEFAGPPGAAENPPASASGEYNPLRLYRCASHPADGK